MFSFTLTLAHLILIVDILLAIFAVCSLLGNGFILGVIVSRTSLRRNESIYLFAALSLADFMLAFTILPFITLLIYYWGEDLNYPAKETLIFALPIVTEIKINSVLTVAIAVDRFTAVQWPIYYKLKSKGRYVVISFLLGVFWAIFDTTFLFSSTTIGPKPGCAAPGCFMSEAFRYYWGVSNMFVNLIAMVATLLVMVKIRCMQIAQQTLTPTPSFRASILEFIRFSPTRSESAQSVKNIRRNDVEQNKISHANRVAVNVLLCSGVCILLPSVFAGLGEMLGLPAFQYAGPFVAVGLVLCGFLNTFIYAHKHRDIHRAICDLTSGRTVSASRTESNVVSSYPPVRPLNKLPVNECVLNEFNAFLNEPLQSDVVGNDGLVVHIHRFSSVTSDSDTDEVFV